MGKKIRLVSRMLILFLIPLSSWIQPPGPGASQASTTRPKRILVLYSYNFNQPAQQLISAGLESARRIAGLKPDDYLHEYLDISPQRNPEQRRLLRDLLLKKYAGQRFDLIITVFNNALNFLMDEGGDLSPDSPCLALYGQERPNLERGGKKVIQSPLYFDTRGTLELALRLFPETRRVLFVSGKSTLDIAFGDRGRTDFELWHGKLEFEYTSNRSLDEVLDRAARLSPGAVVIYSRVSSDITGKTYSPIDVAVMLAKASNAPVFCLATSQLDTGVVGGSMVDVEALSAMLGRALPLLGSTEPLPIEPASHFVKPMVNWQQVMRWGIDTGRLPADSIIINRPPTLWNQYKIAVIVTMLVLSVLIIFIFVLVIQNRRRTSAEKTARLSEARFRVLIDQAPYAIVVYDVDRNRFVDANIGAEKLFGCSLEELRKSDILRFYHQEQPDKRPVTESVNENVSRAMAGEALQCERIILSAEGIETFCDVHLTRLPSEKRRLIRASYIDITERKLAEKALRQSEERYRSILWIAMDGFWLVDRDGRILEVNDAYCQMSGYSADELMTMCVSDLEALEAPEETAAHIETVMRQGRARFESRHRHKDGHLFDVEVSVTYQGKDEGRFASFIRDITERKRAEEEREKLQAQLNQAQRMEYVGRLAGGVAHDFNNTLGVILGRLDMIMEKVDPAQHLFDELEEIRQAAERSVDLTRQLLAFARKQITSPRILDLNETVEGMLRMMRRLIGEDIDLAWLPAEGLCPVLMDPSQVDQILANLCINARDAIEGAGKITIETSAASFDAEFCAAHLDYIPGDYTVLIVSDNGYGMDKEIRDKIFEPFFTTKGLGRGTGLGLSTVYGIVKQNKGIINVYSERGEGTTFKVYLPCHPDKEEPVEKGAPTPIPTGGHETILLVEDNTAILKMTTMMIEGLGYNVLASSTPGEAIDVAGNYDGEIHLIISDVIMPGMNGWDLVRKISDLYPNLKNLYMSGYTAHVIAHHGVLEEGINFIQKPFSLKSLKAKLREVLDST